MSNLENLTQKILRDAESKAQQIKKEAKEKNEHLLHSQTKEAEDQKKRMLERAKREAALMKERVISNAELRVRDEKLKAKQQVIDRVFRLAKERLLNLDEETYVKFLQSNIKGLNLKGNEVLVVPEKLIPRVKTLGLKVQVAEDEWVDSGFLLKDEDMVLNFSFDSLVDYLREELESEIAQGLFKE